MPEIVEGNLHPTEPAGWERNRSGEALDSDIPRGRLVKRIEGGYRLLAVGELEADGISLKEAFEGSTCEVGLTGEMDGFVDLPDGDPLYPSAVTPGRIQTEARAGSVIRMKAISETRISYNFV